MKKEEIKGMLERLEKATEGLARYCHAEDCEDIWDCPLTHDKCYRKLGLDTAIAWEMATELEYTRDILKEGPPWPRERIKVSFFIASALFRIVHHHPDEFPKLWSLVGIGYDVLSWVYNKLEEEGAWEG